MLHYKTVFVLVVYLLTRTESFKGWIPVGCIFDKEDKLSETGFRYGISTYNEQVRDSFHLTTIINEKIDVKDSFSLATEICSHLHSGVFLLFGSKVFHSREIIQSFTERLHMPYLTTKTTEAALRSGPFEIHMRPSVTDAIRDVIRYFRWKNIHYVYDSDAGLVRLQELLQHLKKSEPPVKVKIRRLHRIVNAHDELRALDKSTDQEEIKHILLDLESETSYYSILRQIREVGMNKYAYKYLLATLDFINLDLEKFKHGGVNITGFQILDNNSKRVKTFERKWKSLPPGLWPGAGTERIQVDAALAVDAVKVIEKSIKLMLKNDSTVFRTTFRRGEVYNYNRTRGIPCSENVPWMHGPDLIRNMKQIRFNGLTGNVAFNDRGFRTDYKLEVLSVGLNYGPFKVGNWTAKDGFLPSGIIGMVRNKTKTEKLIVTSILEEPFLFDRNKDFEKTKVWHEGNERYEGFCVDLIRMVAEKCGFDYTIQPNKNGVYGTKTSNDSWNGMIGELLEGNASIAVAPLTITKVREEVVDFSKPFMMSGVSIIIKKPEKQKPGVFSFMKPFSISLWMCIVIGYIVVAFGMFLVSRFSPAEWKTVNVDDEPEFSNKFSLSSSLWFAMGSLMLQGSDTCPRSAAGRIIGGTWWFAVLIIISSYTANLAAFLTIEKMVTAIESADDLARQTEISYGTLDSGSTQDFFRYANVPTYQAMWNYMSTAHPSVFTKSVEEGIARVRSSKGKYAFLLESVYNEYNNNQQPCDTMQVGPPLSLKGYGIATPKHSELRDDISIAVLQLIEDGSLIKLKKTWWVDKGECGVPGAHGGTKKKSLSLSNVAGVFFILIGGLVLAIIIGVSAFLRSKSKSNLGGFALIGTDSAIPIMAEQSENNMENGPRNENSQYETKMFSYPAVLPPKYNDIVEQNGHTDV